MNRNLMNIARIALRTLVGAQQSKASKRRHVRWDHSTSFEQLELRKLLTATITDFTIIDNTTTGLVTVSGTVQDDWGAEGLVVTFGGALDGTSVEVGGDGTFAYYTTSAPQSEVTAQTLSWDLTLSNVAVTTTTMTV